jgi:drug/metabolite transporter (DMT)-like permease
MENLRAQSVAVLSYLDPVFALILSAVILGERMTVFGIIGAVLIIGSAIISETGNKE